MQPESYKIYLHQTARKKSKNHPPIFQDFMKSITTSYKLLSVTIKQATTPTKPRPAMELGFFVGITGSYRNRERLHSFHQRQRTGKSFTESGNPKISRKDITAPGNPKIPGKHEKTGKDFTGSNSYRKTGKTSQDPTVIEGPARTSKHPGTLNFPESIQEPGDPTVLSCRPTNLIFTSFYFTIHTEGNAQKLKPQRKCRAGGRRL